MVRRVQVSVDVLLNMDLKMTGQKALCDSGGYEELEKNVIKIFRDNEVSSGVVHYHPNKR